MHEFIQEDKNLLVYLNTLGDSVFDPFWMMISNKWIWIPLYFIFLYLIFRTFKLKSVLFILIFIALAIVASDQLANIFKFGIARLRPCHDPSLDGLMRKVECGGQYGFYSAHASTTFLFATFMSFLFRSKYKFIPYILFPWAIIVSYSRIYLGVHFPFDVAFGALVGFLLGGFFATLTLNVIKKQSREVHKS